MPGMAASTSETWLFGSAPNCVEAPENSFELEITWAWTSSPMTISHSPVFPLISDISSSPHCNPHPSLPVMPGLDPGIQGYRLVACPGPSGQARSSDEQPAELP